MSSSKNQEFEKTSFLSKSNSAFIEQMYLKFINKDKNLPESWLNYFKDLGDELNIIAKEINGPSWGPSKIKVDIDELQKKIDQSEQKLSKKINQTSLNQNDQSRSNEDSIKAVAMIRSYRQRGHLIAKLDPLELLKSDY
ncbi:2-oxoglutarate dehydrogenase E1 component, partial [Candidatus Pelagibacter sp.]|nr:2-oxoglutarate dehydrogenase E1 component [Candidatus Pelagibacter sp.]